MNAMYKLDPLCNCINGSLFFSSLKLNDWGYDNPCIFMFCILKVFLVDQGIIWNFSLESREKPGNFELKIYRPFCRIKLLFGKLLAIHIHEILMSRVGTRREISHKIKNLTKFKFLNWFNLNSIPNVKIFFVYLKCAKFPLGNLKFRSKFIKSHEES